MLREVRDADLDVLFEHQLDEVANHMAAFTSSDPGDRAAFDARWARIRGDDELHAWVVVLAGEVVGSVLCWPDPALGHSEVSYWIAREHWGRGIATRALQLLLREIPTRPLYGRAASDNHASLRVLEKCGFRPVGTDRGYAAARGEEIEERILRLDAPPPDAR